ncbi:hypothetical protein PFISCL1PPCAC_10164 [Pristionchus fissidentatus]|uniref:Sjoegren syndrome/scleroderma autoantigen 1 n=1 Tax=Pristionchus fissidentatus TaxID=1538716 RepID=A0AAV5VLA8_9BILA|nr:hypothetical protein PFISCL1PPCAC_10164 [Pristionchus fissidentatus]
MVHRGFKRESAANQSETMTPFNTEKREVLDTPDLSGEVSRRMGELLLRGYTMLNAECECGGILMEDRNGVRSCVACEVRDAAPVPAAVEETPSSSIDSQEVVDQGELREYVSTNMGRLLMRGYTMLDAYCTCSCILMEDREGTRKCLACEFRENKRKSKDTVAPPDMGFKVIEIPLNGEIPSSSRVVQVSTTISYLREKTFFQMDMEDYNDEKDVFRDTVTARMGELLLKGVAMLDEYCDCGGILMQERSGRRFCVDCEVRNQGKGEKQEEKVVEPEEKKKKEEKPAKKVSFHSDKQEMRTALPPSEWKTVAQMTVETKLIWLSNQLSKTQDYDEIAKILDLIDKASRIAKGL